MKKPAKNLPDTNTIIRYLTKDNEILYAKAKDFFDNVKNGSTKAIIIESVIAESIYVLTKIYKVPKNVAASSLIEILRYKGIANHDQQELIYALVLFSERNLNIVDCILCVKAAESDLRLFSFDDVLHKITDARSKAQGNT